MIEINNTTNKEIEVDLVKRAAKKFLEIHQIEKDLSIAFVSGQEMKRINQQARGINKTTDVLSFVGDDDFGEIIIDPAQIKKQAQDNSKSEKEEMIFILTHGLLHLLGHEDDTEEKRQEMISLGEEFIQSYIKEVF